MVIFEINFLCVCIGERNVVEMLVRLLVRWFVMILSNFVDFDVL